MQWFRSEGPFFGVVDIEENLDMYMYMYDALGYSVGMVLLGLVFVCVSEGCPNLLLCLMAARSIGIDVSEGAPCLNQESAHIVFITTIKLV